MIRSNKCSDLATSYEFWIFVISALAYCESLDRFLQVSRSDGCDEARIDTLSLIHI